MVTAALAWSGLRLVAQQRELDERSLRQHVDSTADVFAADVRERIADQEDGLERWLTGRAPVVDGAAPGTVACVRRSPDHSIGRFGGLLFLQIQLPSPLETSIFGDGEKAELALERLATAADEYRRLSSHPRPHVRAGALMRLARVSRKQRDFVSAIAASTALVPLGDIAVDGVPATLSGLDGLRLAYSGRGDQGQARALAERIRRHLDAGDWPLERGTAEFFRSLVTDTDPPREWHLASAVAEAWARLEAPASSRAGAP